MPISSLSISVTETSGPSSFASALALIHPAVPHPSTTMRIVPLPLIARRSAGARRRRGPAFPLFQFLALRLLDEASDHEESDSGAHPRAQKGTRQAEPARPPREGTHAQE